MWNAIYSFSFICIIFIRVNYIVIHFSFLANRAQHNSFVSSRLRACSFELVNSNRVAKDGWIILLVIKRSSNIITYSMSLQCNFWFHEDWTAIVITRTACALLCRTCTAFAANNKSNNTKNPIRIVSAFQMNHQTDYMQIVLKIIPTFNVDRPQTILFAFLEQYQSS